jgi:hypothetical protein
MQTTTQEGPTTQLTWIGLATMALLAAVTPAAVMLVTLSW